MSSNKVEQSGVTGWWYLVGRAWIRSKGVI